jgi:hypothetical protein
MVSRKDLIIAVLSTFCLTLALFMTLPAKSSPDLGEYDPWVDINDDGTINFLDAILLGTAFGTTGTPINKTELLLELQSRLDSLNVSLLDLEAYLMTRIAELEASLAAQQSNIDGLNDTIHSLEQRIDVLEYNFSTLNACTITYNSTYSTITVGTTETLNWVDMPYTSVNLNLNTTSYLLIMFSADAYNNNNNLNYVTFIQSLVDSTVALPGSWITLTPNLSDSLGTPYTHRHYLNIMAYSYNFYIPSVPPGNHTIKIQWRVTGGTAYVYYRTLTVLAIPAQ